MFNTDLNNGGGDRVGTIKAWGGTTAPAGWLICDGSAISRTLYAGLFAVIGTTYGAGDGTTTFNLPDMLGFCKNQAIIGNGTSLGFTNGTNNYGTEFGTSTYFTAMKPSTVAYGETNGIIGSNSVTGLTNNQVLGVTTDGSKSGIVTANIASQESRAIIKY